MPTPPDTARDVSAAKVAAAEAGLLAARSALQTHGAIGFTQEHDLGLLLLRAQALRSAWGDTRRTGAAYWRRCDHEQKIGPCWSGPSGSGEQARRLRDPSVQQWNPSVATTNRSGDCCASRSVRRPWSSRRTSAARAANSPTPRPSSPNWVAPWCPPRCSAPRWRTRSAGTPGRRRTRHRHAFEALVAGESIGTVVFDPRLRRSTVPTPTS